VRDEWDGQFAIATLPGDGAEVTYLATYPTASDGVGNMESFLKRRPLPNEAQPVASSGDAFAGAFAVRFTLAPHEKRLIPMALSWDLPIVEFGGGRKWDRHYTHFFGNGRHACLGDRPHRPRASRRMEPGHRRLAEAHLSDEKSQPGIAPSSSTSSTTWPTAARSGPMNVRPMAKPRQSQARQLHLYGVLRLPLLRKPRRPLLRHVFPPPLLARNRKAGDARIHRTIPESNPQHYIWGWKSTREHQLVEYTRKVSGAAPHDLGAPGEDPVVNPNQYNYQDVSNWRDLNSKYVLMIWRDYALTGATDEAFLRESWPAVKQAMEHLKQYDTNGDGLIENGGFPDQTYDDWTPPAKAPTPAAFT
jgi:non-lysosomal glucosylceramidase